MLEEAGADALRRLWHDGDRRGVPAQNADKIRRILAVLNRIKEPGEIALYPGWRLHPLTGDLAVSGASP